MTSAENGLEGTVTVLTVSRAYEVPVALEPTNLPASKLLRQ